MIDAATAARYNVRPLLPGPEAALRDTVLRLGVAGDQLSVLARHGAVEALAVQGLTADLTRILERALAERGGTVMSDANGTRAVILAPLMAVGQLPAALAEWSTNAEGLGAAIGEALMARGAPPPPVRAGRHTLDFATRTLVMGIVNVTPDSFAGDAVQGASAALARARTLVDAGADIIDVGGESTRPNAKPVDAEEELARAIPAVRAIAAEVAVPVSIDTRKAAVAEAAIAEGAVIVNDIWGLHGDAGMAEVAARHPEVALVVMHNQRGTEYGDILEDIAAFLRESVRLARSRGVDAERLIIDPGFGFGKTPEQNLEVVRRLGELRGLGRPILLGASRKHTIGLLLDTSAPEERDIGTAAMAALGVAAGVSIVRAHNVAATRDAVRVADAVVRGTPPALRGLAAPGPTG